MNGVRSLGITACDPVTGNRNHSAEFEYCLVINTETKLATRNLKGLFPPGSRTSEVLIVVENTGSVQPELE
jgi:hypothetical protein